MGNKRQSMAAKQKDRRKNRLDKNKTRKKAQNADYVKSKMAQAISASADTMTLAQIANALVDTGANFKKGKPPKNEEVLGFMSKILDQMVVLHAAVEIVDILYKEDARVYSSDQLVAIDKFDEAVVKLSEDFNAIIEFIDAGRTMEDYLPIFLNMTSIVQDVTSTQAYGINDLVIVPEHEKLREYLEEHMQPDENSVLFSMQHHERRIKRIGERFATRTEKGDITLLDALTAPATQLFGDEGLESNEEQASREADKPA